MDNSQRDARLNAIAEAQYGVFSRKQAEEVGFGNDAIKVRIAQRQWHPDHPNIYRAAGCPPTLATRVHSALLYNGPDAALSHLTAAIVHRIDVRLSSDDVFVTVPQNMKRLVRPGMVVTRSRTMDGHVERVRGLPVMTFDRTVVDLGHILGEDSMLHVLYDVIRSGRTSVERLTAATERVERRAGCAMMRTLLRTFDPQFESWLEGRAAHAMRTAGIELESQVEVHEDGLLIARLDFADRSRKLAVEIDGRSHAVPGAAARDRRRDRRLAAQGWITLRFDSQDVLHRTAAMIRELRAALDAR
jgi:very-short-patch-repair endonuclease